MKTAVAFLVLLFACCSQGTLYGYFQGDSKSELISIDITTGAGATVCDLTSLPVLAGASGTSSTKQTITFYSEAAAVSPIALVEISPKTCKSNIVGVSGLGMGQDEVRDLKVNYKTGDLYMVLPNPNCMHGSLDHINGTNGKVAANLADVIDPEGLNVQSGISPTENVYYTIGLPFPAPVDAQTTAQINAVDLVSGNISSVTLKNDNINLGSAQNYTMAVFDRPGQGTFLVGAISPASEVAVAGAKSCSPSGFFSVNTKTGNVTCAYGPINMQVALQAEVDYEHGYLYQVFLDAKGASHLFTFDVASSKVVNQVPCPMCSSIVSLAYIN